MTDYCFNHSSPMPLRSDDGAMRCQVCWVETTPFVGRWWRRRAGNLTTFSASDLLADRRSRDVWRGRPNEANAHDPADVCEAAGFVSTWLPRVWVNAREKAHAAFSDENIANAGAERGLVVWFRTLDLVEVPARDTLLAGELRREEHNATVDALTAEGYIREVNR